MSTLTESETKRVICNFLQYRGGAGATEEEIELVVATANAWKLDGALAELVIKGAASIDLKWRLRLVRFRPTCGSKHGVCKKEVYKMGVIRLSCNGPVQAPKAGLLGLRGLAGEVGGEVEVLRYTPGKGQDCGWLEFEATFGDPGAAKAVWDELQRLVGASWPGVGPRRAGVGASGGGGGGKDARCVP